jgi:Tfp pilus assembly protein PilX
MIRSNSQQGIALLTSLLFLVIITIIAVVAIDSSNTQLRMANSQEEIIAARQVAQSAIDNVINNPNNFVVTGTADTENTSISLSGLSEFSNVSMTVTELALGEAPRGLGVSGDKFQTALFNIDSDYDNVANGRGEEHLTQGFLLLIPKL